jgi:hypothetical protein
MRTCIQAAKSINSYPPAAARPGIAKWLRAVARISFCGFPQLKPCELENMIQLPLPFWRPME